MNELKLKLPIIQAPMAGVTKSRMVIESCKAGILGSLGAGMMNPQDIRSSIREIKHTVNGAPFNVNLFVIDHFENGYSWEENDVSWLKQYYEKHSLGTFPNPSQFAPNFHHQLDAVLEEAPPIASFTFGILTPEQMEQCHKRGIKVVGTATSVLEALEWEKLGADYICVQGIEAGGHRGNFLDLEAPGIGLFPLIPEVVSRVKVPVIAAGGIMDGKSIVSALLLGASAVQMGTIFLTCDEAGLPGAYKKGITNKSADDTAVMKGFSGRYARGIKNTFSEYSKDKPVLPYPVQNSLTQPMRKASTQRDDPEHISLWAGQGVNRIRHGTISDICSQLKKEMEKVRLNQGEKEKSLF